MKKKMLWAIGLVVLLSPMAFARGPKEKLATPIFEDQTNRTEHFSILVGSTTAIKLWTPPVWDMPKEYRHLRIQNNAASASLHLTTYPYKVADGWISATTTANAFSIPVSQYLDLSPKTTWYAIYDTEASSIAVRVQADFHDQNE